MGLKERVVSKNLKSKARQAIRLASSIATQSPISTYPLPKSHSAQKEGSLSSVARRKSDEFRRKTPIAKFEWANDEFSRYFLCRIVLSELTKLDDRALAIKIIAVDLNGSRLHPTSKVWHPSKALDGYYVYSPTSTTNAFDLPVWETDSIPNKIILEVYPWTNLDTTEAIQIPYVAVTSEFINSGFSRKWKVVAKS